MARFAHLQPGATVVVVGRRGSRVLRTVERVTKTQIILDSGAKFTLRGKEWGASEDWYYNELEEYDKANWQAYLDAKAAEQRAFWVKRVRAMCANFIQHDLTDDEVEVVYQLLRNKGMEEVK